MKLAWCLVIVLAVPAVRAGDTPGVREHRVLLVRSARGESKNQREPSLDQWKLTGDERNWRYIVLHHSATESGSVEGIDQAHRRRRDASGRPWRGIGYHFVIGNGNGMKDGEIAATFRWVEQTNGAHAGVELFNELGVGICLIGNFDESPPTPAQIQATRRLIRQLRTRFDIAEERIMTHRDLKPTACPGARFPLPDLAPRAGRIQQVSGEQPASESESD